MVVSLFPKRRRRRRFLGLPSREIPDPPSFSDLQPEITVPIETVTQPEEPVDILTPVTPRAQREAVVTTPVTLKTVVGNPITPKIIHETLATPKTVHGTPRVPEMVDGTSVASKPRQETEQDEISSEVSISSLDAPRKAANVKDRLSGTRNKGEELVRTKPPARRSSRLLEVGGLKSVTEASKVHRRVSLNLRRRSSSTCRTKRRESSLSKSWSAFSAGEENTDYNAFLYARIPALVISTPTTCSRASMTNQSTIPDSSVDVENRSVESKKPQKSLDKVLAEAEPRGDIIEVPLESTAKIATRSSVSNILGGPKGKVKVAKKSAKIKAQTREMRTSTTGLEQFVRSARQKRSMCVQADLDRTAAIKSTVLENLDSDDVLAEVENTTHERSQPSPEVGQNLRVLIKDSLLLPGPPRLAVLNENSCLNLVLEREARNDLEPQSSKAVNKSLELGPKPVRDLPPHKMDALPVTRSSKRKDPDSKEDSTSTRAQRTEVGTKNLPGGNRLRVPSSIGPEESSDRVLKSKKSEAPRGNVSIASSNPGRDSNPLGDSLNESSLTLTEVLRGTPLPVTDPGKLLRNSSSSGCDLRKMDSLSKSIYANTFVVAAQKKCLTPASFKHQSSSESPIRPKRSRTTRAKAESRRKSSGMDFQRIAQRIQKKIERKRIIENTVYRRINLIYEELWEDFLETFYPEKWRQIKDVWMARKAEKRLEEEQRGLGDLDEDMEREVQRGTALGAAKYIKEFEEKRAEERNLKLRDRISDKNNLKPDLCPASDDSRRQSRRIRDLKPQAK